MCAEAPKFKAHINLTGERCRSSRAGSRYLIRDPYLIVVSLAALTVPAARHTFDHFLPLAGAAGDAAHRGRQRGVICLPTHGLHLEQKRQI